MQTQLIEGVSLRSNDDELLAAINKKSREGGGLTMSIGIRNDAGEVYRSVKTLGMGEFIAVVSLLADQFGMTDELAEKTGMRWGFDAIFG